MVGGFTDSEQASAGGTISNVLATVSKATAEGQGEPPSEPWIIAVTPANSGVVEAFPPTRLGQQLPGSAYPSHCSSEG